MYIIKGLHSCRTKLNILNALASYRCFLFKISTTSHVVHMLIFVILIRHINTKLLKSCSESQKLLKVAKIGKSSKVAQKLPSTICLGLVQSLITASASFVTVCTDKRDMVERSDSADKETRFRQGTIRLFPRLAHFEFLVPSLLFQSLGGSSKR